VAAFCGLASSNRASSDANHHLSRRTDSPTSTSPHIFACEPADVSELSDDGHGKQSFHAIAGTLASVAFNTSRYHFTESFRQIGTGYHFGV
jgi:hypothetical protein